MQVSKSAGIQKMHPNKSLLNFTFVNPACFRYKGKMLISLCPHREGLKGAVEVWFRSFVRLALDDTDWLASCSSCFNPGEKAPPPPQYALIRCLDGAQSRPSHFGESKINCHCQDSNPRSSSL